MPCVQQRCFPGRKLRAGLRSVTPPPTLSASLLPTHEGRGLRGPLPQGVCSRHRALSPADPLQGGRGEASRPRPHLRRGGPLQARAAPQLALSPTFLPAETCPCPGPGHRRSGPALAGSLPPSPPVSGPAELAAALRGPLLCPACTRPGHLLVVWSFHFVSVSPAARERGCGEASPASSFPPGAPSGGHAALVVWESVLSLFPGCPGVSARGSAWRRVF